MSTASQDVQPFVIPDRRVESASRLLAMIDNGTADQAEIVDAAWAVRSIAASVRGGTSPMPTDARLVKSIREFNS